MSKRQKKKTSIDYNDIDSSIIPLIKLLNEKGFITNGCCSGLYRDHKDNVIWDYNRGYITFSFLSADQKEYLRRVSSDCYLKFVGECGIPCYRFEEGSEDYILVESFLCSCRIQNFVPIVNLRQRDGGVINISLDILFNKTSDVVINDRWKKLHNSIVKFF